MKAEKFKTLCRRILHLEPNGWHKEMPDDWRLMVMTRHGVEPLDSWMDEPDKKQILLCGESVNGEPVWHKADELPRQGENIIMLYDDAPPLAGCFHGLRMNIVGDRWDLYDGYVCKEVVHSTWAYVNDIKPRED